MPPGPTLLLCLSLTACAAGSATRAPLALGSSGAQRVAVTLQTNPRPASRIGPPSGRGLSLRRVDRPSLTEPPLALY